MELTGKEKLKYGDDAIILERKENINVYKLHDDSGDTIMTSYSIMEGVDLVYNDVHMKSYKSILKPIENFFELNHCREGRIECQFNSKEFLYMTNCQAKCNT